MPRDKRLYMTFPIDFTDHPKVEQLSDNAFRTFVAMNGYSRQQRLDGRIPAAVATKRWKGKSLAELVQSDTRKPLVMLDEGAYVIRDYAEHQFTTQDEADLHEKRSAAGSAGAKAKALAKALAKQNSGKPEAESGSESGIETDVTKDPESSHLGDGPIPGLDSMILRANQVGISDIESTRSLLARAVGEPISLDGAIVLAKSIASKSAREVRNVDAYIATVCRNSPHEVQQAYFDMDIGGIP